MSSENIPSSSEKYQVRRMEMGDVAQVMCIERVSFTDPWSVGSVRHEIQNRQYSWPLVLVETPQFSFYREEVMGYVFLWKLIDDLHIANLAVRPTLRGQGWGRKLVLSSIYLAGEWGLQKCMLEVRSSNEAARRLYESLGFDLVRIRKDYYRRPVEDALVLELNDYLRQEDPPIPIEL